MSKRDPRDYYPTPPACFEAALDVLPWCIDRRLPGWLVQEPACGQGNLVDVLTNRGGTVDATGLYAYEGLNNPRVNFLSMPARDLSIKYDLCVTNPPYSLAKEFVQHAFTQAHRVMMLLRLSMLGSQERYPFWSALRSPSLIVLSQRPSFSGDGKSDNSEYAWFVWQAPGDFPIPPLQWVMWR